MSASAPPSPSATKLFELITASWVAAAVSAAAELGVADAMTFKPLPVDEIAERIGADADALHRLLRACADLDLVEEGPRRHFALTGLGRALRGDAADSMRGYARWVGSQAERSTMAHLARAVRTGRSVFEEVHGLTAWAYLDEHPETAAVFDEGMTDISAQLTRGVAGSYDFGAHHTLVDVGGGRGRLLAIVLSAHPGLHGVLFDRSDVVAHAGPVLEGVRERCRVVSGDFLSFVPEGGDAYLLSNVIHNWGDQDAARILSHCREAMTRDGRVLLAEVVVPDSPGPARTAKFMDLSMLAHCDGKQRTRTQFAELFEQAGLKLTRVLPSYGTSIVEGVRA
ncbi:acetylserotonin O-methyltransferase [Nocardiopsis dassonvillei]|uniref:acetylserotonin O-methyltransferase n=1 Tax=Nocardiopsis dassonvillei TaxID=2014 RepID=UPI0020100D1A|nr:acetylserotonin O-methyltransferase [Nocardiopsis dassonvillei]MCK9873970.1 acetylserotonin O-methyltransferase [Nocardiopsis dassonvillei]